MAITLAAQSTPTEVKAVARVAALPSWVPSAWSGPSWSYGTIPVSTTVTSTYNTVTMTSDPRMPRGRSRLGFFVSSAAVATMSKPMKAKKTSDAADSTPKTPKLDGAPPVMSCSSGCSSPATVPAGGGRLGGTKGVRFEASKKKKPTTMTSSTTATLMPVMTRLTRADTLAPCISRMVMTPTMSTAPQSKSTPPRSTVVGQRPAELGEEIAQVQRPPLGHDRAAEREFEHQVPADDPRDQLAHGGVGERVGRPGDRHRRGELGVADGGQPAGDRRDHERHRHGRPGHRRGGAGGEGEDAGADDDGHAEDREVPGGQRALERPARFVGVADGLLDGLGPAPGGGAPGRGGRHRAPFAGLQQVRNAIAPRRQ